MKMARVQAAVARRIEPSAPASVPRMVRAAAPSKYLIITADDFGLHSTINAAVEIAHRSGGLSAASIMMGAPGTEDAVSRAQQLPQLRVGLHLTLVDGWSVLPQRLIPSLVGADRKFGNRMLRDSLRFFMQRKVREQLRAEIRAQFEAFAATGLEFDHVNTHKHFHMHPTILAGILELGSEFKVRAVRVPMEPLLYSAQASLLGCAALGNLAARPVIALMRRALRRHGMVCADQVFGTARSGAMNEAALLQIIASLKPGITEIYTHPAVPSSTQISRSMREYQHAEEFAALVSPRVAAAIAHPSIKLVGYRDLTSEPPSRV
jgi:hopanoid biosynthesis associated protein HpnK